MSSNGPDERRIRVRSIRVDGPRFAAHQPTAHPAQWHDAKPRAIGAAAELRAEGPSVLVPPWAGFGRRRRPYTRPAQRRVPPRRSGGGNVKLSGSRFFGYPLERLIKILFRLLPLSLKPWIIAKMETEPSVHAVALHDFSRSKN